MAKQANGQATLAVAGGAVAAKVEEKPAAAIVKAEAAAPLAVQVDPDLVGGFDVVGDVKSAMELMPRLSMYTGSAEEDAKYPELTTKSQTPLRRGDLIVVSEKRKAASNIIIPVVAVTSYVNWPKGAKVATYVRATLNECPPEHRDFGADGTPPIAQKVVTVVVLVGGEDLPMVLNFKSTALRALGDLRVFEQTRKTLKKTIGAYMVGVCDPEKNSRGEVFARMKITPVGDVPNSLRPLFKSLRDATTQAHLTQRAKAAAVADEPEYEVVGTAAATEISGAAATGEVKDVIPF